MDDKIFKSKIMILQKNALAQHMEPKFFDYLPEDFYKNLTKIMEHVIIIKIIDVNGTSCLQRESVPFCFCIVKLGCMMNL